MQKKGITIIGFIAVILFYSIIVAISDFEQFINHLSLLRLEFIPIILILHFVVIFFRIIRQKVLFESISVKISFKEQVLIHISGLSLIMTPGGLGQSIKAYYLKKKNNTRYAKTIALTLVERFYDLLTVIPVILMASIFVNSTEGIVSSILVTILLVGILMMVRNQKIFHFFISKLPKIWFLGIIKENADDLFDIINNLTKRKPFFLSFVTGVISWIIAAIAFYYSFIAFNLNFTIFETTVISLVPIVIGTLSFLPGGIIATEVTMFGFLTKYGLESSISSAIVLFVRITSIWFLTILGIIATKYIMAKNKV